MFKAKKVESKPVEKKPTLKLVKKAIAKKRDSVTWQEHKKTAKERVERVSKAMPKKLVDMKRFDSLVVASNDKVLGLLKGEKQAKTKRQLAKVLKCSFNAAGRALKRLERGTTAKLRTKMVREGDRGPEAKAFYVDA